MTVACQSGCGEQVGRTEEEETPSGTGCLFCKQNQKRWHSWTLVGLQWLIVACCWLSLAWSPEIWSVGFCSSTIVELTRANLKRIL